MTVMLVARGGERCDAVFESVDEFKEKLDLSMEIVAAASERACESLSQRSERVDGNRWSSSGGTGEGVGREGGLVGGGGASDGRVDVRVLHNGWPRIRLVSRLQCQDRCERGRIERENRKNAPFPA
jgi:hypothetical protein